MSHARNQRIHKLLESFGVVRRGMVQRRPAAHQFHGSQRELLGILLHAESGVTIKDIAIAMHISSSAVTQQVEALEKAGYAERTKSPLDGRGVLVSMSAQGKQQAQEGQREIVAYFSQVMEVLSDDELEDFVNIMTKLANHIKSSESGEDHA